VLQKVSLGTSKIEKYRSVISRETIVELQKLSQQLKGLRLCHVNSTPFGGGVAELLVSSIPIQRELEVKADWQIIRGDRRFFTITKSLHNALQGNEYSQINDPSTQKIYLGNNKTNARELDLNYDVFIVNDPQPLPIRHYCRKNGAKWIWRCHIDSSEPDEDTWNYLRPYIEEYDAAVFTTEGFVPPDLNIPHIAIMAPAIDPLSSKNMLLSKGLCRSLLDNYGIDRHRPLIVQVSRFDPWKDPFGMIAAYRLAKEKIPRLQLALIGSFANDDPEAWDLYAAVQEEANKDDDIHVLSNLTGVGNMEVNAFQRASDVVVQKSTKEGFGLVVAEALWKETPVVAGNAGGISLQMAGRLSHYLINNVEDCAERIVRLLEYPDLAAELGREGKKHIQANFLMPRLIRDELSLVKKIAG